MWVPVAVRRVANCYTPFTLLYFTCCNIACLTLQLPHITTGSFQSRRWQPTIGSLQNIQHLKKRNKPSVRWKRIALHKLLRWHYQVGWASGLQFVFFWDNTNYQKNCMNNTVENDFLGFPEVQWLHLTGEVDKSVRFACQIISVFSTPEIIKIG